MRIQKRTNTQEYMTKISELCDTNFRETKGASNNRDKQYMLHETEKKTPLNDTIKYAKRRNTV